MTVVIDLSKTFDSIDHDLLSNMQPHNIWCYEKVVQMVFELSIK